MIVFKYKQITKEQQMSKIATKANEIKELLEYVKAFKDLGVTIEEMLEEEYITTGEAEIARAWGL